MTERSQVEKLTDELFYDIETAQGYAYFSDGETFSTKREFFERCLGRLHWQRRVIEITERFLRRHGEFPELPKR